MYILINPVKHISISKNEDMTPLWKMLKKQLVIIKDKEVVAGYNDQFKLAGKKI